jgi:predicted acylesterase/phospholipase RssA
MRSVCEQRRFAQVACLLALSATALLAGCASPRTYHVAYAAPAEIARCRVPIPKRDLLVTVALSGGGSRAALFGAAGLEALGRLQASDKRSVLEQVSYLSSVSGGSIAAAAYALKKPPGEVRVLEPSGKMSPEYRDFFQQYHESLTQKFGEELFWRQLISFRWINPSLAANSMAEILHDKLLGPSTWNDISQREARGDSPGLIVNATLYNNGRRFAVTPLEAEDFRYDFSGALDQSMAEKGKKVQLSEKLKARWEQLLPVTPADLHISPCGMALASVVTGSASFPPLIGPITLQVEGSDTYWHLGDGGLYENQGVEPLLFMTVHQLQQKRIRRGLIIAFDSSFPFSVDEQRLAVRSQPFSLLNFDFNRIPSIMEERATTYRGLFFRSLQIEGAFPADDELRVLALRHIDAKWRDDLTDLPAACRGLVDSPTNSAEVVHRLALIPTLLSVRSKCDRELLSTAAFKLVDEYRGEILEFINGQDAGGTPSQSSRPQRQDRLLRSDGE